MRFLRLTALGIVSLLLAFAGTGAPADPVLRIPLHLSAGEPVLEPAGDGRVAPRIASFGRSSRAGAPALPIKILLVAIPEGSQPSLRILSAPSRTLAGLDVAPAPRLRVEERRDAPRGAARRDRSGPGRPDRGSSDLQEYDLDLAGDAAVYAQDRLLPGAPVRLGRIGYLREQRFVEVLYSPIQFNPVRRQARFFPSVDVEVVATIADGAAAWRPFRPDLAFEPIYRDSLVNYEQGTMYRVPADDAAGGAAGPATTSSSTLTLSSELATASATTASSVSATASATTPFFKVAVPKAGIYRLTYADLLANAPELLQADPATLALRAEGLEVPISIRDASGNPGDLDGHFDVGDVLEFYGRPKSELPTQTNINYVDFPDIYQANDFTDTQIYWLAADPAASHLRIAARDGAPNSSLPLAADFEETAVWDENNVYLPLEDNDPFFSIPSLVAGSDQATRDISLPLPGLAPVSATATVLVRLRGGSTLGQNPDHETRVWVNGDSRGGVYFTWDGEIVTTDPMTSSPPRFDVSQSLLTNPTTVHFNVENTLGATLDKQYLDTVTIRYRRLFAAVDDGLVFTYPNQDVRFQVSGFSGGSPLVYETTATLPGSAEASPVRITGVHAAGLPITYTFEVRADASAPATRTFVVAGPGGVRSPVSISRAVATDLRDPANAADIIVIAAREAICAAGATACPAPGGALDNLLAYRASARGLSSKVVFIDQIYDEFSFGLRDVNAIRSFLACAFDNWKGPSGTARPVSYVLLVGDATPDYKNTLPNRSDWVDQVPTPIMFQRNSILGFYSSDNWLASFRGTDQIPDVYLGRISTRDPAASAKVFDKVRRYEQSPSAGLWKGHAALVAGDGKPNTNEASAFVTAEESLRTTFFSRTPFSTPSPALYWPNYNNTAAFKSALLNDLQAGAAILSYIGHGSFETWGGLTTYFDAATAASLTNPLLPFMVNINCLAGGFHYFVGSGSLGENMTNNGDGGAIATLAPSGLSDAQVSDEVRDYLFSPLFGPDRTRLLAAAAGVLRARLWGQGQLLDLQSYTYLGDPATLLATPAPEPPTAILADPGNSQVTLSWTASVDAVAGYRVYRAGRADGTYAAVTCDTLSSLSCVDRGVTNGTTYYYYATAFDGEGFEGRRSNTNAGCATGGSDCVKVKPTNPNPPSAPQGLQARDTGGGGSLALSWVANPEPDIKGYTVHYGTQPGQYTTHVVTGNGTSMLLTGLIDEVRYYITLTATNTTGLESAASAEVSQVPHLILGIAPPRAITDLMVASSGANLVLTWSRPTVDIYGRPTAVARYNVYRGTTPGFKPFGGAPLATIADPATTTYADGGANQGTGNLYYLVTAVDVNGLQSGAGRELPSGIADLSVDLVGGSTVHLAWSAFPLDVHGQPTLIDHYQLHITSAPVGRGSLGSSTLYQDNVRSLSFDLPVDSSVLTGAAYFQVLAVDNRGNVSPF